MKSTYGYYPPLAGKKKVFSYTSPIALSNPMRGIKHSWHTINNYFQKVLHYITRSIANFVLNYITNFILPKVLLIYYHYSLTKCYDNKNRLCSMTCGLTCFFNVFPLRLNSINMFYINFELQRLKMTNGFLKNLRDHNTNLCV